MTNLWRGCTCFTQPVYPENDKGIRTNKGCPVHDYKASDEVVEYDGLTKLSTKVYEYECLMIDPANGNGTVETLSAVSTSHAFTEAWHIFEGRCIAVRRGELEHD